MTLNFLIPQLTPRNPLREKLMEQASRGGVIEEGFDEMVAAYEAKFGLDQPLWKQYHQLSCGMSLIWIWATPSPTIPKTVTELVGRGVALDHRAVVYGNDHCLCASAHCWAR